MANETELDKAIEKEFKKATKKLSKKVDYWTYIRIKKSTSDKIKILKIKRTDLTYDATLDYLLSKEKLEFK
jgi:hypothetical protein